MIKKMLKNFNFLSAFALVFITIQVVFASQVSAKMDSETIRSKLGEYSSWVTSVTDDSVVLDCPDKDVDEDYYIELINDISDNLNGTIGTDYCYIEINVEYTVEENGTDFETFRTKMFDIERHLNICWPGWSGRNSLNFIVGYYYYSTGEIASYYVTVQITSNGQSESSEYAQYNELLNEIVTECENTYSSDIERVKFYCDWILSNIKYDINYASTNSACDALINKKAVCGGFANLLRDLCNESGIPAIVPKSDELNHAWNEVYIDSQWYTIDLLNVVSSKSDDYYCDYLFTDPDGETDYADAVEKIKNEMYTFSQKCDDGLIWKLNSNNKMKITGEGDMQDFNWEDILPSWTDYYPEVTELYISSGITSIGDYAFLDAYEMDNLVTVYLPDTLTEIGMGAFGGCDGIQNIYFNGTQEQWDSLTLELTDNDIFNTVPVTVTGTHTHSYGEWIVIKNVTCTEDGSRYKQCTGCSDKIEEVIESSGHKYSDIVTSPTCTEQGYTTHTCSVCGDTYTDTYVSVSAHTMGEWYILNEPTCIEAGTQTRKCENCTYSETATVSVTEHPYSDEWTVDLAVTCTVKGTKSRHCTYCDAITDVTEIVAEGHKYTDVVTAPTCTKAGYTTHTCDVCGDAYTDSEKSATGHSYGSWITVKSATCEDTGSETRQCAVCYAIENKTTDPLGHAYKENWTVDVPATCTTDGSKSHHCSRCDSKTDVTVIITEGHKYTDVVIVPTCTKAGYTTHTCDVCGDTYTDSEKAATGHTEVVDEAVEATCTNIGFTEGKHCSLCNNVLVEQNVIETIPHKYSSVTTDPTCEKDGVIVYTCLCGDTYNEVIITLGHNYSEVWTTDVEPTCTTEGSESRKCLSCESVTDARKIAVTEHDYDVTVYPKTCEEDGYTYKKCKVCKNDEITDVNEATGHQLSSWIVTVNATCVSEGTERADCSQCDYYETRVTEKLLHSYNTTVFMPTCTERGYTYHKCNNCDDNYCDDYKNSLGHSYGEWITTLSPTCVKEGSKSRECTVCNYSETDILSATGEHSFSSYTADNNATCISDGTKTAKCDTCDVTKTVVDENSATGHTEVTDQAVEATCASTGLTEGKHCSRCEVVLVMQNTVDFKSHTDNDNNDICDVCEFSLGSASDSCDCMCHESGIMKFFYKIVRFFWKIFGMNRYCECGVSHY